MYSRVQAEQEKQWGNQHAHEDDTAKAAFPCLLGAGSPLVDQDFVEVLQIPASVMLWDAADCGD